MSRKRGKDKRAAKQAIPEEILAEGSGANEAVEANAQSLADAASDALGPVADVEVRSAESPAPTKRGKKTRATTDAWGQPIEVDADDEESSPDVPSASPELDAAPATKGRGKKMRRQAATRSESDEGSASEAELAPPAAEVVEASAEAVEGDEGDEGDDDAAPEDADMQAEPGDEPTAEAQSEQALEDAVMRAEAEAELGEGEAPAEGDDVEIEGVVGAALPTTAASMDPAQLKNLVEALVFAADKPVTLLRLRQLTRVSDVKRLEQALSEIAADFANRGIALQQVSGGYQFRTNTQYSVWVQQLIAGRPVRLSRAQLETLAIVAYRQPITRPEVDEIRGVDSSATLRLLLDRSLIRVLGKKEDVGRPTLYGTTKEFLDFFSLSDLRELPTLREYSELTAESRKVMSDRLGIEAGGNADAAAEMSSEAEISVESVEATAASDLDDLDDVDVQLATDDAAAVEAVAAVTDVIVDFRGEEAAGSITASEEVAEAAAAVEDVAESMSASENDSASMSGSESAGESTSEGGDVAAMIGVEGVADAMQASEPMIASDEVAESMGASEDDSASMIEGEDLSESMSASAGEATSVSEDVAEAIILADDVAEAISASESMGGDEDAGEDVGESMAGHVDDAAERASLSASSSPEHDLGAPRGSSQEDVIGRSHDAAHDPDEPGAGEAHDLGAREHFAADDLQPADDAGTAGAGVLADGESNDEAEGATNPAVIDASAPDSLDETDEPPAD